MTLDENSPLRTDALTVRYGRTTVLGGVSLSVPKGSVYALLGRNGAGKSSLVRCLLGQQKPEGGQARLFGRDAWRDRAALMENVGFVPETPDAPPEMTVPQIVAFCAALVPRLDRAKTDERLLRFDVPRRVPFGRLSKGQQGAVMLALALGHSPSLLILDDPTLGLDVVARRFLFDELLGDLADRGTTVFITTHDLASIERIADRVGILAGHRLVVEEEMEALRARFRRPSESGGEEALSLEEIFLSVSSPSEGVLQ
jgi:ABC-2 type transport system ATP-binding protein